MDHNQPTAEGTQATPILNNSVMAWTEDDFPELSLINIHLVILLSEMRGVSLSLKAAASNDQEILQDAMNDSTKI